MPNRIIKESICTSIQIVALTLQEEVFFYRLLVNCDDYGLLDARTSILRAKCFPLKIDTIKDKDIEKWLSGLQRQKLIHLYTVDGQPYLKINTWEKHQQIRAKRSKFPSPTQADKQPISDDIKCNQMKSNVPVIQSNPIQSESKSESKYKDISDAPHVKITEEEYVKLVDKFGEEKTKDWIEGLNLWKGSKGKSTKSDYLTILNWDRRERKNKPQPSPKNSDKFKLLY